ncbi:MAG: UPF0758 domain-containing protein [Candidatus Microsaccharimonas sp.]
MKDLVSYDLPREKLRKKGIASLTNAELLQLIIGSGNAQVSVARIAKRVTRLLSKFGSGTTFDQLSLIVGLGPARVGQILACFELASRYPLSVKQLTIENADQVSGLISDHRHAKERSLVYITVDGAKRLLSKRSVLIHNSAHPSFLIRTMFSDIVTDKASGIYVIFCRHNYDLEPTTFELSFARDLRLTAQLLLVSVHSLSIANQHDERKIGTVS